MSAAIHHPPFFRFLIVGVVVVVSLLYSPQTKHGKKSNVEKRVRAHQNYTLYYTTTTALVAEGWRRGGAACSTEGERGAPSGGVVVAAETAAAKKKELLAARWRTSSSSPPRLQLESNSVDFKVRWRKERAAAWELFRHKSKFSTTCCYCHARRLIASVRYIFSYLSLPA